VTSGGRFCPGGTGTGGADGEVGACVGGRPGGGLGGPAVGGSVTVGVPLGVAVEVAVGVSDGVVGAVVGAGVGSVAVGAAPGRVDCGGGGSVAAATWVGTRSAPATSAPAKPSAVAARCEWTALPAPTSPNSITGE
jgi:hypothetical protein